MPGQKLKVMLGEAKFAYLADFVLRVPHREVRAKEDALDAVEVDELAEVALAHEGDGGARVHEATLAAQEIRPDVVDAPAAEVRGVYDELGERLEHMRDAAGMAVVIAVVA